MSAEYTHQSQSKLIQLQFVQFSCSSSVKCMFTTYTNTHLYHTRDPEWVNVVKKKCLGVFEFASFYSVYASVYGQCVNKHISIFVCLQKYFEMKTQRLWCFELILIMRSEPLRFTPNRFSSFNKDDDNENSSTDLEKQYPKI